MDYSRHTILNTHGVDRDSSRPDVEPFGLSEWLAGGHVNQDLTVFIVYARQLSNRLEVGKFYSEDKKRKWRGLWSLDRTYYILQNIRQKKLWEYLTSYKKQHIRSCES